MHFVEKSGADLVRLWVSSVNFTDDVPFSEEMFHRLGDAYRRIRNTLRILLGNLHDYDAAAPTEPTAIDRWILARLAEVERPAARPTKNSNSTASTTPSINSAPST